MAKDEEVSRKELLESFQVLTTLPAWRTLTQAVQGQVDSLQSEVLFSEVASEGDVLRVERRKGMLEGRLSLTMTAQGIMDTLAQDIRNLGNAQGEE